MCSLDRDIYLANIWCVWARRHQHDIEDLQSSTMHIHEFATVNAWHAFCSTHSTSKFGMADLFVFKRDAIPAPEANKDGGQWVLEMAIVGNDQLDSLWLQVVQALIEDKFSMNGDDSCLLGISLSIKPDDSVALALWVAEYKKVHVEALGKRFLNFLRRVVAAESIEFIHFGTGAQMLVLPSSHAVDDAPKTLPFSTSSLLAEARDTGQWGLRSHYKTTMTIVLPGFSGVDGAQLILKNSFIHAVAPLDEPFPEPLQRLRTAWMLKQRRSIEVIEALRNWKEHLIGDDDFLAVAQHFFWAVKVA